MHILSDKIFFARKVWDKTLKMESLLILTCLSLKKWPLLFLDMTYHLSGVHLNIFLAVELLWRQLILTAIELKQWFFIKGRALDCLHCFVFFQDIFNIWSDCSVCCTCGRWSSATRPLSSCSGLCRNLFPLKLFKMFSGVTTSVATSQNISPLSKNVSPLLVLHFKCYSFPSFSSYSISLQQHK